MWLSALTGGCQRWGLVRCGCQRRRDPSEFEARVNWRHTKHEILVGHVTKACILNHLLELLLQHTTFDGFMTVLQTKLVTEQFSISGSQNTPRSWYSCCCVTHSQPTVNWLPSHSDCTKYNKQISQDDATVVLSTVWNLLCAVRIHFYSLNSKVMATSHLVLCLQWPAKQQKVQLETVSIAEPLQNRQHAQKP